MKSKTSLSGLFEQARMEVPVLPVSDIKILVESGKTSPLAVKNSFQPQRIRTRMFNPIKSLIMTTFIGIISSIFVIMNPYRGERTIDISLKKIDILQMAGGFQGDVPKSETVNYLSVQQETKNIGVPVIAPANKAVPKTEDELIQGEILRLSKAELTRLGLLVNEKGYYFFGSCLDNSNLDYFPVLHMSGDGKSYGILQTFPTPITGRIEFMNDTLVPVFFNKVKVDSTIFYNHLIWFKASDHFFSLLDPDKAGRSRQIFHQASELLRRNNQIDHVWYDYKNLIPEPMVVKVKPEVLKCMGIEYSLSRIKATVRASDLWFYIDLYKPLTGAVSLTTTTKRVDPIRSPADTLPPTTESIILVGISNFGGMEDIDMFTRAYRQLSWNPETWRDHLDLCVPVGVDYSRIDSTRKEVIFWIYPNERFFSCLPPEIAEPMRKEFTYQKKLLDPNFIPVMGGSIGLKGGGLMKDTLRMGGSLGIGVNIRKESIDTGIETVPCVYFSNLCESMPDLDYVNLYPNPANDQLNVDLVLQKGKQIVFLIYDLSGRIISGEGNPEVFGQGGQFRHLLDVSELRGSLYLLVMTDEAGARVTRRFVKN